MTVYWSKMDVDLILLDVDLAKMDVNLIFLDVDLTKSEKMISNT